MLSRELLPKVIKNQLYFESKIIPVVLILWIMIHWIAIQFLVDHILVLPRSHKEKH